MHRRLFITAAASAAAVIPSMLPTAGTAWAPGVAALPEMHGDGLRQVAVMLRGPWAIEPVGEDGDWSWTLHHMPTKTRAAWSEDSGVMEEFSGVLDGLADFTAVTADDGPLMAKQVYDAGHAAGFVRWGSCAWSRKTSAAA